MEAFFPEIYNETIRDLLSDSAPSKATKHEIRRDPKFPGQMYVTNVTPTVVTSEAQVQYIYMCHACWLVQGSLYTALEGYLN